jgi:hypothetical protein
MGKQPPGPDATLADILEGVDIVGTILHEELPQLQADIDELKIALARLENAHERATSVTSAELAASLNDIRELLEMQEQRILKLDMRLAQMAGPEPDEDPEPEEEVN